MASVISPLDRLLNQILSGNQQQAGLTIPQGQGQAQGGGQGPPQSQGGTSGGAQSSAAPSRTSNVSPQSPVTIPEPSPPRGQAQGQGGQLEGEWEQFFSRPDVQTAMLQFGVSMLAPNRQGTLPQLGAAIGDAGGAVNRRNLQEFEQQQAQQGMEIEQQRADAATTQAGAAETSAEASQRRAGVAEGQLGLSQRQFEHNKIISLGELQAAQQSADAAMAQARASGMNADTRRQGLQAEIEARKQEAERLKEGAKAEAQRERFDQFSKYYDRILQMWKAQSELSWLSGEDNLGPPPTVEEATTQFNVLQEMLGGEGLQQGGAAGGAAGGAQKGGEVEPGTGRESTARSPMGTPEEANNINFDRFEELARRAVEGGQVDAFERELRNRGFEDAQIEVFKKAVEMVREEQSAGAGQEQGQGQGQGQKQSQKKENLVMPQSIGEGLRNWYTTGNIMSKKPSGNSSGQGGGQ